MAVWVDGKEVIIKSGPCMLVCDICCQLEEKGYSIGVINPTVSAGGTVQGAMDKVCLELDYYFSKWCIIFVCLYLVLLIFMLKKKSQSNLKGTS